LIDLTAVKPTEVPITVESVPVPRVCLDLGCGQNKREGFTGVDKYPAPGVDIVHDLAVFPWPFADNSVDEAHSSHNLEHIDGVDRLPFFQELYRVLKPGGTALFITPSADSDRAYQDPTHKFPPVVPGFYQCYLNKEWRVANKLNHGAYDEKPLNFLVQSINVGLVPELASRNDAYRDSAMKHWRNVTVDLYVTVVKA
jgi:ubiquinone/menaquinone biosynthesis C-methylase UbiE